MSVDLRPKLVELAKEIEEASDSYRGVPPWLTQRWADRIGALLASHEKREGEDLAPDGSPWVEGRTVHNVEYDGTIGVWMDAEAWGRMMGKLTRALRSRADTDEPDEDEGLVAGLERHLEDLEYEATGPRFGPATNGFAYAEIPDWLLRRVISALRSHTDREPEPAVVTAYLHPDGQVLEVVRSDGSAYQWTGREWKRIVPPIGPPDLRPHADSEPDTWCIKNEAGEVVDPDVWRGATLDQGETLHPVRIGPPVQPEEELGV